MDINFFSLDAEARAICEPALDNPEERYKLRAAFYEKFGFGKEGGYGYGASELAFIRWEINRGVLNPLHHPTLPGSEWWRWVNWHFLYHGTLAMLLFENGVTPEAVAGPSRLWLEYMNHPSPQSWYAAHNGSIVHGYYNSTNFALKESDTEQLFIRQVLVRLLYAHSMVMGEKWSFGILGEFLANPRDRSVEDLVHIPDFYPDHYPLSATDVLKIEYKEFCLMDWMVKLFDKDIIGPHITQIFNLVGDWIRFPPINYFVANHQVIYPHIIKSKPTDTMTENTDNQTATTATTNSKKKIIVLGGGPSALAATYELTDYENWQDKFDITLYQMGWRLGGKTATGRGIHNRVEERGIHIFQGWYDNAFRLIKDAYQQQHQKNLAPDSPFQDWKDAFQPDYPTLLTEFIPEDNKWHNWPLIFPETHEEPGTAAPPSMSGNISKIIEMAIETIFGSPYQKGENNIVRWIQNRFVTNSTQAPVAEPVKHGILGELFHKIGAKIESWVESEEVHFLFKAHELAQQLDTKPHNSEQHPLRQIAILVKRFRTWFERQNEGFLYRHDKIRHIQMMLEWMDVNFTGMFADLYDEASNTLVYSRINKYDYRDWLRKHGGSEMLMTAAPIQFMYYGSFANLDGEAQGKIAADVALRMVMLSITYKGSLVWKMRAGTADTLITPLYLVLKDRGVNFQFFHKVKKIHYSTTGDIEEITIGKQVRLKDASKPYTPTIRVNGIDAWPSHPLYEQLQEEAAQQLQEGNINLESSWTPWQDVETIVLKKGIDFDQVVLGIPLAALNDICSEIVEKDQRWKDMVEKVKMVPTFGLALWIRKSYEEMGMRPSDWGLDATMEPNTLIYANPLFSWTGMNLILKQESWPADNMPKQLSYFCGTYQLPSKLPPYTDYSYPEREKARLIGITEQWLHDQMGWFWPKATTKGYPCGFDLNLLVDPDGADTNANGIDKLQKQYFSLNIDPTNYFSVAEPGADQYRMQANESGFSNLFLTGDWTNFGLNIGHLEGAVVSGLRSGQVVLRTHGFSELKPILGDAERIEEKQEAVQ
ncbi:MAG: NAD(P)-binding protein [Flavisolibacter sp.]|nr:NAD(P)-binding protein [Flavisolibacter sp.]